MNNQHPDVPLLVGPVYLAGQGDTATIYDPLCGTHGWGKAVTSGGLMFTGPRQDVQVAFLPDSRHGGWKVTRYDEPLGMPAWSASFSRNTPAEITAAFTRALVDCLESDNPYPWDRRPADDGALPADVLARQGWRASGTELDLTRHSPDGHAYFCERSFDVDDHAELAEGYQPLWTMYACVEKAGGQQWHAGFSNRTPLYLVTQAVRAFSSTEPVLRPHSGIPERNLPYVTTAPAAAQATDLRRSAALARTQRPSAAALAPVTDATAPGPIPPMPLRHR